MHPHDHNAIEKYVFDKVSQHLAIVLLFMCTQYAYS